MTVYMIETRYADYNTFTLTASYERAQRELSSAEERNVGVIITPYNVEDLDEGKEICQR